MIKTRFLLSLGMIVIFVSACAPAPSTDASTSPVAVELSVTPSAELVASSTPSVDLTATNMLELLSATPPVDAQPVATSRGPELHATDPTTVSLASGGLQFVEFFRFT